jgi:hypothetical protein
MTKPGRMAFFAFFLSLTFAVSLFAQSDLGTISGFVKDPSGATVANAKVTIQNNRGVDRQASSNDSGLHHHQCACRPLHRNCRSSRLPAL